MAAAAAAASVALSLARSPEASKREALFQAVNSQKSAYCLMDKMKWLFS